MYKSYYFVIKIKISFRYKEVDNRIPCLLIAICSVSCCWLVQTIDEPSDSRVFQFTYYIQYSLLGKYILKNRKCQDVEKVSQS